jgi:biopolymer transport protein ExbB
MGEALLVIGLLFVVFFSPAVTLFLLHRLWKRNNELALKTKLAAVVVAVASMLGVIGLLSGLVKVFGAVGGESVDPSQKARILAEGMSIGLNGVVLGLLLWIPSVIVLWLLSRPSRTVR